MKKLACRVGLVFDPVYGDKVAELLSRMPLVVADSTPNRDVVERLWAVESRRDRLAIFAVVGGDTTLATFRNAVSTADYQWHSMDPKHPYHELECIGLSPSHEIKQVLEEKGFRRFRDTEDGFVAFREQKVEQGA